MSSETKMTGQEKADAIHEYECQCNGSDEFFRHWIGALIFTSGVEFLVKTCGAMWLVDLVASHQPAIRRKLGKMGRRDFQVWRIIRSPKFERGCIVECWSDTPGAEVSEDGPASVLLARQEVEYTDFPAELFGYQWWVEEGTMLLKGER